MIDQKAAIEMVSVRIGNALKEYIGVENSTDTQEQVRDKLIELTKNILIEHAMQNMKTTEVDGQIFIEFPMPRELTLNAAEKVLN